MKYAIQRAAGQVAYSGILSNVGPKLVPAAAQEVAGDSRIIELDICNPSGQDIQVWITDGQTPPVYFIPPVTLSRNGGILGYRSDVGRFMPGAINWGASVDRVLHGCLLYTRE